MNLPKTQDVIFTTQIPSTNQKVIYRMMKAREEKNLLIAKMSDDPTDIFNAIYQCVQNCLIDVDMSKLTLFDMEYLFLKIRGSSISNIIKQVYTDTEDNKDYEVIIDIDQIKVENLKNKDDFNIILKDTDGVKMKYPSAEIYRDKGFLNSEENSFEKLIVHCIDKIYTEDQVFEVSDFNDNELIEWLEDLDIPTYNKISQFVSSLPKLSFKIEYTNSLGTVRKIELSTLGDFFMLR